MGGSNTTYQPGSYGTLGTLAPGNIPPGRWDAASWTDKNGNFWLFGGSGYNAATNATGILLNDLWEFNPSTNEWAWVGGSSTLPKSAIGWPGVYGTLGTPAAGNIPGSRAGAATWADTNGNLWLFGGSGWNDLWEYSPSTNEWTWIGGSSTVGTRSGVYGTLGVPAPGSVPGGRAGAESWTDGRGNFWLFGGSGVDANGVEGGLNDLWEFNPSTREWAWMGGSSTVGANGGWPGVYGTLGTPAAGNIPGGRTEAVSWTDGSGNLWLFGGSGYDSAGNQGNLNDLWKFNPNANEWTWMGGSTTEGGCAFIPAGIIYCEGQAGVYGSLGVPGPGNNPGGRSGAASWIDDKGNLWLFGGYGTDSTGNGMGGLNDLWEYQP
jgi:N-acetylneuraminic acid mutarotase